VEIIAIGNRELMDGFALLGIRTYADADAAEIDELLAELARKRERALVYIQQDMIGDETPMVQRLRLQGGSILICEIPRLGGAEEYRPQVETLIGRVLGSSMREGRLED
jgi:vacuolar-type H+-ATPase subunit F/Vma7